MKRMSQILYLDQNIWINLSKHSESRPYAVFLDCINNLIENKKFLVPLDEYRIYETFKQQNVTRALDLMDFMAPISRGWYINNLHTMLFQEFALAMVPFLEGNVVRANLKEHALARNWGTLHKVPNYSTYQIGDLVMEALGKKGCWGSASFCRTWFENERSVKFFQDRENSMQNLATATLMPLLEGLLTDSEDWSIRTLLDLFLILIRTVKKCNETDSEQKQKN